MFKKGYVNLKKSNNKMCWAEFKEAQASVTWFLSINIFSKVKTILFYVMLQYHK